VLLAAQRAFGCVQTNGGATRRAGEERDVMRAIRRVVLVLAVAGVSAGAGSALLASPAFAGGVDPNNNGLLSAAIYNLSPYTWTLVAAQAPANPPGNQVGNGGWATQPQPTIQPGGATVYRLQPWDSATGGICLGYSDYDFDAYITYRVDVLGGPPEYANLVINGVWNQNACLNGGHFSDPGFSVYFTSAPPPSNYDAWDAGGAAPSAQIPSPQLTYAHNVPYTYDQTFQITGNYTVDASTDLGAPFVSVLNAICGTNPSDCSFTQTGPLQWGIEPPVKEGDASNCTVTAAATRGLPAAGAVVGDSPPDSDPDWFEVGYEAAQSATLSVGGGLTVGTEFNLFDTISGSISVKIEAEHEWQEVKTLTRSAKVFIPSNNIASVWVAPVVGTVTGTLVVSNGSATFTATNFTEERSGVSKDDLTPAFNVITQIRPMTPSEFKATCQNSSSTQLGATKGLGAPAGRPPLELLPGRGVAKVELGQTQAQVLGALGQPSVKRFLVHPCAGLAPGCDATAGRGGRWSYRRLVVVFAADDRVSGLIYSGSRRSANGVGVGSSIASVRAAYPNASCTGPGKQRYCTLQGTRAGGTVKTVFRFVRTRAGRYDCDRVLIYVMSADTNEVTG
jgi:hypothetical protein